MTLPGAAAGMTASTAVRADTRTGQSPAMPDSKLPPMPQLPKLSTKAARKSLRSPAQPKPGARTTVSALDRGLALLQCFGDDQRLLGPTELARLTGIPRPSVTRLAATLVAHRWLRPEPGGERYMLGAGVVSLAQVFLSGLDVRAAARGPMQALAERTCGSVYLAVRDGLDHSVPLEHNAHTMDRR